MSSKQIQLGALFTKHSSSISPKQFPNEIFELYSVPAYENKTPDIIPGSEIGSSKQVVEPNDVLLCKIVPHIRRAWVVGKQRNHRIVASGEWIVFKSDNIYPDYFKHFLVSDFFHPQIMRTVSGVGGSLMRARPTELGRTKISLPPLEEQKRIAAILDKADDLRQKRHQAIAKLDELLKSLFLEMFVLGDSSDTFIERHVSELVKNKKGAIRTGPFGSQLLHSEFTESGIFVLGIDNVVQNEFVWQKRRYISEEKYKELRKYTVYPGDVLISIMGTCGRCAVVPSDIPRAINTKHLCCITLDQDLCLPEYLQACFLMHPNVLIQLGVNAKGAIMPGLNMTIIKNLSVPIPPITIQKSFVKRVSEIKKLKQKTQENLQKINTLFSSLQQRAFNGEL